MKEDKLEKIKQEFVYGSGTPNYLKDIYWYLLGATETNGIDGIKEEHLYSLKRSWELFEKLREEK